MAGLQSVKHPSPKVMEYAKALQKALHASGVKGGNPIDLFGSSTAMHQRGGVWTEERRQLHARIYDKLLAGAQPVDNPLFVLLGGGSASGKSTLTSGSLPEIPGSIVRVDSDQIKAMLPEYAQTSGKDARAAAFVHDESAFMAKELAAIASSRGYNTMLDGTGNGSEGGLAGKVGIAKKRGMKVVAVYATTDLDTALKRNAERAKTDGRMVPNSFLRYSHSQVSALFPRFVKNGSFDEAHLYETTGEPKKIATYRDGALDVHDQGAWQSFLNKASE
jgi:predicted ABC-type ATPase